MIDHGQPAGRMHTTGRGDVTELAVALALMRSGRTVLRPLSAGLRYDLLIDDGNRRFTRVQCKTGRVRRGAIVFKLAMFDARRPNGAPYHGQADAFGVYCPELGRSFLVPLDDLGAMKSLGCLRIEPAKNGQLKGVRDARRYEIR